MLSSSFLTVARTTEEWKLQRRAFLWIVYTKTLWVFESSHLRFFGWSIRVTFYVWDFVFQSHVVLKKERPPFRARDDAHHHPGAYTFSSAKSAKTHVGDAVNHYTPHPRACACRCSLFRERERDFSPTNQLCTFLFEAFGKKEHPPRHNERNDTSENNNALNNPFSFSHHRKQPRFRRRRRRRRRKRGCSRKRWEHGWGGTDERKRKWERRRR
jgi:hypothetical protein